MEEIKNMELEKERKIKELLDEKKSVENLEKVEKAIQLDLFYKFEITDEDFQMNECYDDVTVMHNGSIFKQYKSDIHGSIFCKKHKEFNIETSKFEFKCIEVIKPFPLSDEEYDRIRNINNKRETIIVNKNNLIGTVNGLNLTAYILIGLTIFLFLIITLEISSVYSIWWVYLTVLVLFISVIFSAITVLTLSKIIKLLSSIDNRIDE